MTDFFARTDLTHRVLVEKLAGYFRSISAGNRLAKASPRPDFSPAEIRAAERACARQLALAGKRRRKPVRREPVTTEEKILDLSG